MTAPTGARPDLRDLVGRRAWVRIAGPTNAVWEGEMIAYHEDPGVVIEQTGAVRICLPAAYTITEVERPAGPEPEPGMPGSPEYQTTSAAALAAIHEHSTLRGYQAVLLAEAIACKVTVRLYQQIREMSW